MKVVWQDEKVATQYVSGIYKREGLFKKRLICYFIRRRDALETCKVLGRGFTVARTRLQAQGGPTSFGCRLTLTIGR